MAAPLLSFLGLLGLKCLGWRPGSAGTRPGQAVPVECEPVGTSSRVLSNNWVWISLQDGEHTAPSLLQTHLCHCPHCPPPQIHRAIYFIFALKEDNGEEEALTV